MFETTLRMKQKAKEEKKLAKQQKSEVKKGGKAEAKAVAADEDVENHAE